MSALSLRARRLWRQFRESFSSAGRLVLYIQIVTVVLILGSVVSIETLSWFAGQRLKDRLSGILLQDCLLYTSPSPRDKRQTRMPSSA